MSKNCPPLLACPQFFFMLLRCKSANLGAKRTYAEHQELTRTEICMDLLFIEASWSKRVPFHKCLVCKNTIRFARNVSQLKKTCKAQTTNSGCFQTFCSPGVSLFAPSKLLMEQSSASEPRRTFHRPHWHMYPPPKTNNDNGTSPIIGNTSQNCGFSIVMSVFWGVSRIFHQSILAHTKSKGQMRNGVNFATEGSKLFTNSVGIWNYSLQGTNISPTVPRLFPWWDMLVS